MPGARLYTSGAATRRGFDLGGFCGVFFVFVCVILFFDIVGLGREAWAAALLRALFDVFLSTFVQCAFLLSCFWLDLGLAIDGA